MLSNRKHIAPSKYIQAAQTPEQEETYQAKHTFSDFGLSTRLLENIERHGYTNPTAIQDQAIPVLMQGKDVVGIANTGTGKTAAFLLPLLHKVSEHPDQGVLILAPTRELAVQIAEEFRAFAAGLPLGLSLCIGGANMMTQISQLRRNPHFVIGTPGRIKDLIQRGNYKTKLFTNVVLDEVDRMLDIGFRKDIQFIIDQLPPVRHSAFFSATMDRDTEEIAQRLLSDPTYITVSKRRTNLQVEQDVVKIAPGQSKVDVLHQLLIKSEFTKVMVFGRTKHGVNKLEEMLINRGLKVTAIHGNKSQNARQRSLQVFKSGRVQVLLATDVAARGIDIEDISHVINYDEPNSYEDYIHRMGRTGRAGKRGKALTFVG